VGVRRAGLNLGLAVEIPPGSGQYQFTDSQAASNARRLRRVHTPYCAGVVAQAACLCGSHKLEAQAAPLPALPPVQGRHARFWDR